MCVLGIGGSALGNIALHTALNGPFHDLEPPRGRPRLFVLDNVDHRSPLKTSAAGRAVERASIAAVESLVNSG